MREEELKERIYTIWDENGNAIQVLGTRMEFDNIIVFNKDSIVAYVANASRSVAGEELNRVAEEELENVLTPDEMNGKAFNCGIFSYDNVCSEKKLDYHQLLLDDSSLLHDILSAYHMYHVEGLGSYRTFGIAVEKIINEGA